MGAADDVDDQAHLFEDRLAVNAATASRITRLSDRQLDYWAGTGLIGPSITTRLTPGRRVRLYGFLDLLALMVAAELKERRITLQHIRAVVRHLRSRGYDRPLTEVRFATLGREVYFQHDDGSWEGGIAPDQLVLSEVLNLRPLRRRIAEGVRRSEEDAGQVERRRGTLGSKPVLAGTRVPVETVRRYLDAGRSVEQIIESFPVLTRADVEAVRAGRCLTDRCGSSWITTLTPLSARFCVGRHMRHGPPRAPASAACPTMSSLRTRTTNARPCSPTTSSSPSVVGAT